MRSRAIRTLGRVRRPCPPPRPFACALDDPNSQVQEAARKSRYQIGDTLRAALVKMGADEEVIVGVVERKGPQGIRATAELQCRRSQAHERLKTAGAKNLHALMAAVRCDDDNACWNEVAQIIAVWGEPVLPLLARYADDKELRVRCNAWRWPWATCG